MPHSQELLRILESFEAVVAIGLLFFWFIILFILPLFNTLYGLFLALAVSSKIHSERERGTHDLLCILPTGALGVLWVLAVSCYHRRNLFNETQKMMRSLQLVILALLFSCSVIVGIMLLISLGRAEFGRVLAALVQLMALIGAVYIDYIQSIVLALVIGMLAATREGNKLDASLWAVGVFGMLQLASYVCAWFIFLPIAGLRGEVWLLNIGVTLSGVGLFWGLREALLIGLWRLLLWGTNAQQTEFELISENANVETVAGTVSSTA
jgi:hypothetical protein